MRIELFLSGVGDEDMLSRRLVRDAGESTGIAAPQIARRAAAGGEKGIIEQVGAVSMTLLNAGGAQFLFDLLRPVLSLGRARSDDRREIVLTLPDGAHMELRGGMSDAEFLATRDRVIALMQPPQDDAPA